MRLRPWLMAVPVLTAAGLGLFADQLTGANAKQDGDPKPSVRLPLTQVVMFNSGVGYYARSGEVTGNAASISRSPKPTSTTSSSR